MVQAAQVTVEIAGSQGVTFVGALNRWDMDGNPRHLPNSKAKIDVPEVDAVAKNVGAGRWVFENLPPGKYDLVLMGRDRLRIEGWEYAPVLDFDPFFPPDATTDEQTAKWIADDISNSRHYENKVVPLRMGGDDKAVRILIMLIRDQKTSYEGHLAGAATMRFELWQYDWRYGGWVKNARTQVMHRVMSTRDELRQWTWVWDPKLGAIEVKTSPVTIEYEMPKLPDENIKGLYPY